MGWGLCWAAGPPHPHPIPPLSHLQVQEMFLAEGSDRLKLMVLYSGEEDEKLRRAASGTLAMLTALHPPICKRIPQVVSARGGLGALKTLGQHPVSHIPSPWWLGALAPEKRATCRDLGLTLRWGCSGGSWDPSLGSQH